MRQILWMWNSNLLFSHTHGGEVRERNELIPKQIYRDSPCSSSEIRNLFIHTFWDDIEFNWISKWVYSNANNFRYANDSYYFGHNSNCLLLRAHTLSHAASFRSLLSMCFHTTFSCLSTFLITFEYQWKSVAKSYQWKTMATSMWSIACVYTLCLRTYSTYTWS